jgi:hypothetical protein
MAESGFEHEVRFFSRDQGLDIDLLSLQRRNPKSPSSARKTPSWSNAPAAVDEGLKTNALPGGAAVFIVARDPAQAGVVAAEFGKRCRSGNGIRHVIVAAVGVRDGVPANRAGATLKPNDLP